MTPQDDKPKAEPVLLPDGKVDVPATERALQTEQEREEYERPAPTQ